MKSLFKTLTKCAAGIEDSVIVHSIDFIYHIFYTMHNWSKPAVTAVVKSEIPSKPGVFKVKD